MAKKGVIDFQTFLLELKAQKIIDDIASLTAKEKVTLKEAFEQGKSYRNADSNLVGDIERAIKDGDFVKLEKLLLEPGIVRFYRNADDFKDAIARGENVFYVGKHSDIVPRSTNVQSHHGVNSVWMKAKYIDYSADKAPSVYMLNNPNHNATRGVFNTWAKEIRLNQGLNQVDYSILTKDDILILAERQFAAADVPKAVTDEYFRLWNDYLNTLTSK